MNMSVGLQTTTYIAAIILFIKSLGGLSRQESAKKGNYYGMLGMLIAVLATIFGPGVEGVGYVAVAFLVAASIGIVLARRVEMIEMPQLVAALHSFVGLAAVLVGLGSYLNPPILSHTEHMIHLVEVYIGVFIGAITFTGSIVAYGKLQGIFSGKPFIYPGRHLVNILIVLISLGLMIPFMSAPDSSGMMHLMIMVALASVLGIFMVTAIGGADMPVVVSMLNSYSGWAAAAAGFMLSNDLLIVTGALVGSSGAILSYIMCAAMNRSFFSVILGGFGTDASASSGSSADQGEVVQTSIDEVSELLKSAKSVVITPGYGMAVAKAQFPIQNMTNILKENGCNVRFAIHPVAGRLPGHMNVLLAEANVPYDIVLEMDEINDDLPETDVAIIVGANDIVNPGAMEDEASPIYGMPVIEVWNAKKVIVLKRGMATGYAGVENPLFFKENTMMLFGDAKQSIDALVSSLQN